MEIYLEIERKKEYVLLADSLSDINDDDEDEEEEDEDVDDEEIEIEDEQHQNASDGETKGTVTTSKRNKNKGGKKEKQGKESLEENQSMLAEWENIHNKVLFDAVNDALDDYRPYG